MGNPIPLLDGLIASGQFSAWVDTHTENQNDKIMWEMYLHKLGAFDERSFAEYKSDILRGQPNQEIERPSDEQLCATVQTSFEMLNNFEIERG